MLKNWFSTFKTAVSEPKKYKELSRRSFWSAFGYLFLLILIGIFLKMVVFSTGVVIAVPFVKTQLPQVKEQIHNAYPKDLVVDIRNGTATTNVQEPYVVTLGQLAPQLADKENINVLTIDTQGTAENYPAYKTVMLLTKNSIAYPAGNRSTTNSYEVFPLSDIKDPITVNKALYDQLVVQILPFVDKVPQFMYVFAVIALILFPIFGASGLISASLFYLLIMTVVLIIISKLMKKDFTYKTLYKASLYGLTMPLLVTYVAELLKIQIPSLYNLAFLVWMICILTLSPSTVYTQINARPKKVSSR